MSTVSRRNASPKNVENCVKLRTKAGVDRNLAFAICNKLNNEGKLGRDGRVKKKNSKENK